MQDLSQDSEEYENLSLKLIAIQMYSDDIKGLDCSTCEEKTKKKNNCDMNGEADDAYYHPVLEISINTCPLNCIFTGHYSFLDKYIYYTTTSAPMPSYEKCDANFWRLYRKFDNYKNLLENSKIKGNTNA